MGFQFFHVESYAVKPSAKSKRLSIASVLAEARRDLEACPHVDCPLPPVELVGSLDNVAAAVDRLGREGRQANGKRARKDTRILLSGVISWPVPTSEPPEAVAEHEARAVKWLRQEHGDRLRAVVRHGDESHYHLHFYVVADPQDGPPCDLHPGIRAKREAEAESKSRAGKPSSKAGNAAYKAAMRGLQDRFHAEVGAPLGLTRLGPKRRRLSRQEWQAERREVERQAQAAANLAQRERAADVREAALDEREEALSLKAEEVEARSGTIQQIEAGIATGIEAFELGYLIGSPDPEKPKLFFTKAAPPPDRPAIQKKVGPAAAILGRLFTGIRARVESLVKAAKTEADRVLAEAAREREAARQAAAEAEAARVKAFERLAEIERIAKEQGDGETALKASISRTKLERFDRSRGRDFGG